MPSTVDDLLSSKKSIIIGHVSFVYNTSEGQSESSCLEVLQ